MLQGVLHIHSLGDRSHDVVVAIDGVVSHRDVRRRPSASLAFGTLCSSQGAVRGSSGSAHVGPASEECTASFAQRTAAGAFEATSCRSRCPTRGCGRRIDGLVLSRGHLGGTRKLLRVAMFCQVRARSRTLARVTRPGRLPEEPVCRGSRRSRCPVPCGSGGGNVPGRPDRVESAGLGLTR
jgi:hypothetical protein